MSKLVMLLMILVMMTVVSYISASLLWIAVSLVHYVQREYDLGLYNSCVAVVFAAYGIVLLLSGAKWLFVGK